MALKYYLKISGIAGDSTSDDHKGAFDVSGYSFDVSALINAMNHGSGGGQGKPTFSPLTVDLDLDSGLTALLKSVASGKQIPSIELQGVSPDGQTVYDLKLGAVTVTNYHDNSTGHDMVSFSYDQVSLTTKPQSADGSLGKAETFEWNVATNKPNVDIPDPVVPASGPTGGDAQTYYLTIDGIAGGSTSDGHKGAFDVNSYSFDVNALVGAMNHGTGGGNGKATFSPLTVDLDLDSGLTALLKNVASGKHIPSIELQGVSADGQTVYELKLGDVVVTSYHDNNTGHDMVSFSYSQVSLTTTPQNADGSLGKPSTFEWNVATNKPDVDIPDPKVPASGPTGGDAQNYYLTIDGIAGDSNSKDHKGAFEVEAYSFDVSALVDAMSHGTGVGNGKTAFSPLTVELDLDSGLTALLKNLASGKHIPSIELEGVSADGQTVYDLKLGDVTVTSYHDSGTGKDMVSFSYDQVSLTTKPQNADGSLGKASTFEWNVATNNQHVDIPDPKVPASGPTGGDAQTYYLTIHGVAGDSTSDGHKGAFDVSDYSFDVSALMNATGHGTGGGQGKPTFSPLTVDLDLDTGLTALLKSVASGKHIPSIELQGVSADGQTVYELKLGDVTVTNYHDSSTGHDMASFSYSQVSLTTKPQNADGSLGKASTFEWNVATNSPNVQIPDPVPASAPTGSDAQNYYLTIDGIAGDSTSDGHKGAFDVSGYSFDVSGLVSAMSHGSNGGNGKATFSPLTVDLDLDSGLTALLKNVASGKHIPSIELQGVSADGKTVYDLKLGDVTVTNYHDSSTGHDMLSFSYGQVSLTTKPQNADGSLGKPSTFEWNVAANNQNVNIPDPKVPTDGPTGGDAQTYYLTIDGITGDSASDGHKGAFDVQAYSFDVGGLVSAMSHGSNGGNGKAIFSPLTVDLDSDSGLTALLKNVATGKHIPSIELEGVSADGQTVYELKLGDVTATSYHDDSTGHEMLSFSYGQVSLTTKPQNADGTLGKASTFEWNVATNKPNVDIPDPKVPADADQQLLNGNDMEFLMGGPGQILTGHAAHDQFVFTGNFGSNEITNFHHNADHILLEKSHFGTAGDILEHYAHDDGHGNTVITDPQNPNNVIILDHVSVTELEVSDFVLL